MRRIEWLATCMVVVLASISCKADKLDEIDSVPRPDQAADINAQPKADGEVDGPKLSSASKHAASTAEVAKAAKPTDAAERWQGSGVSWAIPDGWRQAPGTNMRFATVTNETDESEILVSVFPGDVGGTLANVNRWRAQMGLFPIGATELPSVLKTVTAGNGSIEGRLVDLTSAAGDRRMLTAILPQAGADQTLVRTWFFKLTADPDTVVTHESAFVSLVQSVAF